MFKIFFLTFISIVTLQAAQAQQSARASVSVTIVSMIGIKGENKTVILETSDNDAVSIPLFLKGSAKQARPSRLSLPVATHKVNFGSLQINDNAAGVFDISLPEKITLKNVDGSETVTAYQFECTDFQQLNKLNRRIELSAMVAITNDQLKGAYTSISGEVIVNYN